MDQRTIGTPPWLHYWIRSIVRSGTRIRSRWLSWLGLEIISSLINIGEKSILIFSDWRLARSGEMESKEPILIKVPLRTVPAPPSQPGGTRGLKIVWINYWTLLIYWSNELDSLLMEKCQCWGWVWLAGDRQGLPTRSYQLWLLGHQRGSSSYGWDQLWDQTTANSWSILLVLFSNNDHDLTNSKANHFAPALGPT